MNRATQTYNLSIDSLHSQYTTLPATLRTITTEQPVIDSTASVTGKFFRYPNNTNTRIAEGGLRLQSKYKKSVKGTPLITIITACFNSEETIEQTFASVFYQDYNNIEYIVIDGASTDNTLEIIKENESKVDYYISEPDNGLYAAMNKGLSLATGDYILILNSDDWYTSDAVSRLVSAIEYSKYDIVSSLAMRVYPNNNKSRIFNYIPYNTSIYLHMTLRHETMLISSKIYNTCGPYNENYRIISDFVLTQKLFQKNLTVYQLSKPLLNFRTSGISTTNKTLRASELVKNFLEIFPFLEIEDANLLATIPSLTQKSIIKLLDKYKKHKDFADALYFLAKDSLQYELNTDIDTMITNCEVFRNVAMKPCVTVIISIYSTELSISETLDSVLSQPLTDIEIICILGTCSDELKSTLEKYTLTDSRIRLLSSEKNLSITFTQNEAIRLACGEYVFFVDSGDTLPQNTLQLIYSEAKKHGSDITKGRYNYSNITDKSIKNTYDNYSSDSNSITTNLEERNDLIYSVKEPCSYLYKVEFIKNLSSPSDIASESACTFTIEALCRANKITLTPYIIYNPSKEKDESSNVCTLKKVLNSIEFRRRAYNILRDFNYNNLAQKVALYLYEINYYRSIFKVLNKHEHIEVVKALRNLFLLTSADKIPSDTPKQLLPFIHAVLDSNLESIQTILGSPSYNIIAVTTLTAGEESGAYMYPIKALQQCGVNIHLYPLDTTNKVKNCTSESEISTSQDPLFSTKSIPSYSFWNNMLMDKDIIHLHWFKDMYNYNFFNSISNKPNVWTLYNTSAFTGGCQFLEECTKYESECLNCPLFSETPSLAHEIWKQKKEIYSKFTNLQIVVPSQWMADCVKKSSLLGKHPIYVIPFTYPTDVFKPINKYVARSKLNLPLDKKIVAINSKHLYCKNTNILRTALAQIFDEGLNIEIVTFGNNEINLPYKAHNMGYISNTKQLSLLYSASDVYLFPPSEDNASFTIGEALLCGTPVVAFPIANIPEIIQHKKTGYIASPFESVDFANGIRWILEQDEDIAYKQSLLCWQSTKNLHTPNLSVLKHINIYDNLLLEV